jgi:hypothetical protein
MWASPVDAALVNFERRESVTIPSLPDVGHGKSSQQHDTR